MVETTRTITGKDQITRVLTPGPVVNGVQTWSEQVGVTPVKIAVTPSLDTLAYATGDTLAVTQAFAGAARMNGGSGKITKLVVIDRDNTVGVAGELWLFDTNVTPAARNAPHAISDADATHCVAVIPFGTYFASANNTISVSTGLSVPFHCDAADTALYGILVTRGAPTYTAGGLTVQLTIAQD